jgi:Mor family transcriptional regulator
MGIFSDDIVRDILARVVQMAQHGEGGFTDAMAEQIERQVKADWGGTEPYIRHDVESRRIERNDKIQSLWDQGHRDVRQLATRFGLSTKQVRRIVDR